MNRVNPTYEAPKIPDPINDLFKTLSEQIDMTRNAIKENDSHLESFGNALDSILDIVNDLVDRLERIENDR